MIEQYQGIPIEERRETRSLLFRLAHTQTVRQQLATISGTWLAGTEENGMDLAFVKKNFKKHQAYAGLDILGFDHCIGIKVTTSKEDTYQAPRDIQELLNQGATVATLTKDELTQYIQFYETLDQHDLVSTIGRRIIHEHGLRLPGEQEVAQTFEEFLQILKDNRPYFKSFGAEHYKTAFGLDLAFVGQHKEPVFLPFTHTLHQLTPSPYPAILAEYVVDTPLFVPGVIVRQPNENKWQAYKRLTQATGALKEQGIVAPDGSPAEPLLLTKGQMNLWRKLGAIDSKEENPTDDMLTIDEVVRFLYLGNHTLEPGPLAKKGMSLPGKDTAFFGADILFYYRRGKTHYYQPVDHIVTLGKNDKLVTVNQVAGLVLFPESALEEEKTAYLKRVETDVNRKIWGGANRVHIVGVTPTLFSLWQAQHSPFETTEPVFSTTTKVQPLYGVGSQGPEISLHIFQHGPTIGGNHMTIMQTDKDEHKNVIVDFGKDFSAEDPGSQEITSQAPTAIGLNRKLQTTLPRIPGVYDTEYLLASLVHNPSLRQGYETPVNRYIAVELLKRVTIEDLIPLVGEQDAKTIFALGRRTQQDLKNQGKNGDYHLLMETVTHAHADHDGDIPVLTRDAPFYGTTETIAHELAKASHAKWIDDPTQISLITKPKQGSSYTKVNREFHIITNPTTEPLHVGSTIMRWFPIDHSVTGSCMIGVGHAQDEREGVLFTGDLRLGPATEQSLSRASGMYNTIILETTNPELGGKASTSIHESDVADTLTRLFQDPQLTPGAIIVVVPPNHIERMSAILHAAHASKRTVALSARHAETIEQMISMKQTSPTSEGFKYHLPDLGSETALWVPPNTTKRKYQRLLEDIAGQGPLGVLTPERLQAESKRQWVILISSYDMLINKFGSIQWKAPLSLMYCCPFPYEQRSKNLVGTNYAWVKRNGGKWFSDFDVYGTGGKVTPRLQWGLHASGHVTFEEMADIVIPTLLGDDWRGKELILIHGEHPQSYAYSLQQRLKLSGKKDPHITTRVTRMNPLLTYDLGHTVRIR